MRILQFFNPAELRRSFLFAAAIATPLCLFGIYASMYLIHANGPILLLFAPTFSVFALFSGSSTFTSTPNWVFYLLAALAELIGVFVVVHLVRMAIRRAKSGDA